MCFATLALATDYDCWNTEAGDVVIEEILAVLNQNVTTAQRIIAQVIPYLPTTRPCACGRALENAIITDRAVIPQAVKQELSILVSKYLGE
jgi:5'-methylthioadenosine phosphorylase